MIGIASLDDGLLWEPILREREREREREVRWEIFGRRIDGWLFAH